MIEFRQKVFSKFRQKEVKSWIVKKVKETNPVTAGLGVAGTGLGAANFAVNKKRKDADIELREEQIKVINDLSKALDKIEGVDSKKHSVKLKKAYKRQIPEIEHPCVLQKTADALSKKMRRKKND